MSTSLKSLRQHDLATRPPNTNPATDYLASLAPGSRPAMRSKLAKVAELIGTTFEAMPWDQLKAAHVDAIRAKLSETQAPATVNATLCALRGVAGKAFDREQLTADEFARIKRIKAVKGSRLPAGRAVESGELRAMFEACRTDNRPQGTRDAAVIALAYSCGLRRAEIASLDLSAVHEFMKSWTHGEIQIQGKGNRERIAHLTNGAAKAMTDWLEIRGDEAGPLFCQINRHGNINAAALSGKAVGAVIQRRAEEAGVEAITAHDLRRSCASDLLDAGVDIATVAGVLGHANIQTTARYDRRPEDAKRKAVQALHVPY